MRFIWTLYHLVCLAAFTWARKEIRPTHKDVMLVISRWLHHKERLNYWWSFR